MLVEIVFETVVIVVLTAVLAVAAWVVVEVLAESSRDVSESSEGADEAW